MESSGWGSPSPEASTPLSCLPSPLARWATDQVVAVLGVSPSLAAAERRGAHAVAQQIGVQLVEVETAEGDRAAYRANGPDRCYTAKTSSSPPSTPASPAAAVGRDRVRRERRRCGRPDRPGARAAVEHACYRPLPGRHDQVRSAYGRARPGSDGGRQACCAMLGVPDSPPQPVTPEKLSQIERAEAALRHLGFGDLRVRHHDEVARSNCPPRSLSCGP